MCVIVHSPANTALTDQQIRLMFNQNPDGIGVMFKDPDTGHLLTAKSLPSSPDHALRWLKGYNSPELNVVIHFRWATHGPAVPENTHPFRILTGMHMVHNGVLPESTTGKVPKGRTDTETYIERVIRPLLQASHAPGELIRSEAFKTLVGAHIGHSKLVFMDRAGSPVFVNRSLGDDIPAESGKGTIWVSNTHWKTWDDWEGAYEPLQSWSLLGNRRGGRSRQAKLPAPVETRRPHKMASSLAWDIADSFNDDFSEWDSSRTSDMTGMNWVDEDDVQAFIELCGEDAAVQIYNDFMNGSLSRDVAVKSILLAV